MKRVLWVLLALAPTGAAAQNPLDGLRLEDLSATRDRPLFAPTRRAPPPVAVEASAPPPPVVEEKAMIARPQPFELIGSAIGDGKAFALLRNKATGKIERLRLGEADEGWRIGVIGLRSVTLERDGATQTLALAAPHPVDVGAEVADEPAPPPPADPRGESLKRP